MSWGNYLFGITVRADSQFKTMQELMQYTKQNPEKLSYGSPGWELHRTLPWRS